MPGFRELFLLRRHAGQQVQLAWVVGKFAVGQQHGFRFGKPLRLRKLGGTREPDLSKTFFKSGSRFSRQMLFLLVHIRRFLKNNVCPITPLCFLNRFLGQ